MRHNPTLDAAFDDLFLPGEARKPVGVPAAGKGEPGVVLTPARLRTLALLAERPQGWKELRHAVGGNENTFSMGLQKLKEAGLVAKQDGPRKGSSTVGLWEITAAGRAALSAGGATGAAGGPRRSSGTACA
jgi:DNA-binding transcriptional ArsR family regulator